MEIKIDDHFARVFVGLLALVLLSYRGCTYMEYEKEISLRKAIIEQSHTEAKKQMAWAKGKSNWNKKARKKK